MSKAEIQAKFAVRLKTRDEDLAKVLIPQVEAWLAEEAEEINDLDDPCDLGCHCSKHGYMLGGGMGDMDF